MSHPKAIPALLNQIAEAGMWIQRRQDGSLAVGPTELAKQHAALIAELRPHKQVIAQLIESQLAPALFGDADDDPRFETAECPVCKQAVYVMILDGEPRRLSVHRIDGKTVCTGGGRAAQVPLPQVP